MFFTQLFGCFFGLFLNIKPAKNTPLLQLLYLLGVPKGPSRETNLAKSQTLSDSAETPPLPPVKSDTFLKNIFIAFLSSTAFVCYLEMNLFFSHPKSEEKTQSNFESLISQRQRKISLSSGPPTYSGQNIFMCLLHVLEHFKHFK